MRRIPAAAVGLILLVAGTATACAPPAVGPPAPHAQVVEVVDGDTVVLRSGASVEHVRLIGIDTPEVAHHGSPADCYGPEAAARTAELLPVGSVVRLARDAEPRDVYDRLLAYVITGNGTMVNLQLAAEGFARELAIAPNITVADQVAHAVTSARESGAGLWTDCPADR